VSNPSKDHKAIRSASPDEGEVYGVRDVVEPREPPVPALSDIVERYTQAGQRKMVSAAAEPPPPPRLPMLTGIFTFPWRLSVIASWVLISLGLMGTAWIWILWFGPGTILGPTSVRVFAMPACIALVLTFGYAITCCLTIIESTSQGWDSFNVSPPMEWKEWVWNFGRIAVLAIQASLVGAVVRGLDGSGSWTPAVVCTLAVFPLVLLGALASADAWAPLAIKTVLWSIVPLWWAWAIFYAATFAMAWAWAELAWAGMREDTWATPIYAAPLLAAIILIYARLVGRLAGCIARETSKHADEGDDDA
jgi:hypothetical protein